MWRGKGGMLQVYKHTFWGTLEIFFLKSSVNRMWRGLHLIERDNWRGGAGNYAWRLLMAWLSASSCTVERGEGEGGRGERQTHWRQARNSPIHWKRDPIVSGSFPTSTWSLPRRTHARTRTHTLTRVCRADVCSGIYRKGVNVFLYPWNTS